MPGSSARQGLGAVLTLYRQVLRVHRERLPPPLRSLGDAYVKEEVRRHLKAKTTPPQWAEFGAQWKRYIAMMDGTADLPDSSGEIPPEVLDAMNDEQRAQLAKLRRAAEELARGGPPAGDPEK